MKKHTKSLSLLIVLFMILQMLTVCMFTVTASADTLSGTATGYDSADDVNYVKDGKYVANWGARGEVSTFLSTYALNFYKSGDTYDVVSELTGGTNETNAHNSALYDELQDIMVSAQTYQTSYDATRNLFKYTDCVNGNYSAGISSFYSGNKIGPAWDNGSTWNREHCWPNSKGDMSGNGENDIMMLRPTSKNENGSRGNNAYGSGGNYYNPNSESNGFYDLRGDVARIVLYTYVRWGCTSTEYKNNTTIVGTNGVIESIDLLLEWIEIDPVDTWELGRNDAVQSITGTRNVFVDYPEYAFLLFSEEVPVMYTPSGIAAGGEVPPPPAGGNTGDSGNTGVTTGNAVIDALYSLSDGESLTGNYQLTGKITSLDSYNNPTIVVEGYEDYPVYCYRLADNRFAVGATVTVSSTTLKNYQGTYEFMNCTLVSIEGGNEGGTGTDTPTPPTPSIPGVGGTVSKSHTEIAAIAGVTLSDGTNNTGVIGDMQIKLDDNITIVAAKGSASNSPNIFAESIRFYQNGCTLTIKSANGNVIETVKLTLATKTGGQGPITVAGGTASALTNNVYTITANDNTDEIVITTAGTDKNNRLYVANIEVVYAPAAGGTTPDDGGNQGGTTPDDGGNQGGTTPDDGGNQGGTGTDTPTPPVTGEPGTVTVTLADKGWSNGTQYLTLDMGSGFTATMAGTAVGSYGLSTGKYYDKGTSWRMYAAENASLNITAPNGMAIKSVKITWTTNNEKPGALTLNGSTVNSDTVVTVNATSVTFGAISTTSANGQVWITAIEVAYAPFGSGDTNGDIGGDNIGGTTPDDGGNQGGTGTDTPTPPAPTTGLVVGQGYKLGMTHEGQNKTVYACGGYDSYYLATSTDFASGLVFFIEETNGGYYLYYMNGNTKTYLNMVPSDGHINPKYETAASTVYAFNSTLNTLTAIVNGVECAFATRTTKQYTNIGAYPITESTYKAFFVIAESSTPDDGNQGGTGTDTPTPPVVGDVNSETIKLVIDGKYVTTTEYTYTSSKTGNSKIELVLSDNAADAAIWTVIKNSDGSISFKTGDKFLYCNGTDVKLVSEEGEFTKFVYENTTGGVFIKCFTAMVQDKAQYLEVYGGYLTCYGMDSSKANIYTFTIIDASENTPDDDNQGGNTGDNNQGGNTGDNTGDNNQGGNTGDNTGDNNQGGNTGDNTGDNNQGGNTGDNTGDNNQGGTEEPTTDAATEAPTEETTTVAGGEAPTTEEGTAAPEGEGNDSGKKGCKSSISGISAIIIAIAVPMFFYRKKKDEE